MEKILWQGESAILKRKKSRETEALIDQTEARGATLRSAGLDLFRFLAALVVFLGHAVYFSSYSENFSSIALLEVIRTGTFAVDFFFTLSGYVLASELPTKRWLVARYVRLFPVYLVGILTGSLVLLALNQSLGTSAYGFFLAIFGIQALFPDHTLVINGPLWSLSVELILTPLFLIYWKFRNSTVGMFGLLVFSVTVSHFLPSSVIFCAVPFFSLGALLRNLNKVRAVSPSWTANFVVFTLSISYFIGGAGAIRKLSYSTLGISIKLMILGILIYFLTRMKLNPKLSLYCVEIGKRSYVLYAIHAPLAGLFLVAIKPTSLMGFLGYLVSLICVVGIGTEMIYQTVEKRAITWSRRIRK